MTDPIQPPRQVVGHAVIVDQPAVDALEVLNDVVVAQGNQGGDGGWLPMTHEKFETGGDDSSGNEQSDLPVHAAASPPIQGGAHLGVAASDGNLVAEEAGTFLRGVRDQGFLLGQL